MAAGPVLAGNPAGYHLPPKGPDVGYHVARSPRMQALTRDPHDRDRCFGRDALHLAPDVTVEHQIPDHQNVQVGEAAEQGGEPPR